MSESEDWYEDREYSPEKLIIARKVLAEVAQGKEVWQAMRHNPLPAGGYLPKHILVAVYHQMVEAGEMAANPSLLAHIRMKPIRTLSGVTTVTVLTKAYPCPGRCIFCPTEERMPKSYLSDEPGARRGLQHEFNPFSQVRSRIVALEQVGHPTDKIELLILGGTWSAYPRDYQEEFIKRCFDAMNDKKDILWGEPHLGALSPLPISFFQAEADSPEAATLQEAQLLNESAPHRNVGLVIETRPDHINPSELAWLRHLGVTKVQMGVQSLDDSILSLNQRGHTVAETVQACALLRAAGFKIVLHWMPNLLGATIDSDRADFLRFWDDYQNGLGIAPDEIKIYPCQLLENSELYHYWERGEYRPYTEAELVHLLADVKPSIPRYCRVNRIIRDIPSTHVVEGNKRTSLRQDILDELQRRGQQCNCLRCREVRGQAINPANLHLDDLVYHPAYSEEHFLSFVTPDDHVAGYLRLSLPERSADLNLPDFILNPGKLLPDLEQAAIIREVHVYGQSLPVGTDQPGAAQHAGLGTHLIEQAVSIARQHGFHRLAVISAIGTRPYYLGRGFTRGETYLVREI